MVNINSLYAAEDWKVLYDSFNNVSFKSYDYQSIYNSLLEYIKTNNPDEFNDYVAHSELLAHVNMIAYIGHAIAFRMDLNARENFFATAERRESVLKLAYALSYQPSRNLTANGLVKITSITTTQPVLDNTGNSLAGKEIVWNQSNDLNWYDNFIRVMNNAFVSTNPFGRPNTRDTVESIRTELYSINTDSLRGSDIAHSFDAVVNGRSMIFELFNAKINESVIEEVYPSIQNPFGIVYRNDNNGVSSHNTGFFFGFKQGNLRYKDFSYDMPIPNREELINENNINETDVWVQEIRNDGTVIHNWQKVDSTNNKNIIFNDIDKSTRKIFAISTEENNKVKIMFGDGVFAETPKGIIRVWYRVSEDEGYLIKPNAIKNKTKTISYIAPDNQKYHLTFKFSLMEEVGNAAVSEDNESISRNAPMSHYTQDRMVNGEDYNIFPLTKSNNIKKIKTVNRTYAGHSRYIRSYDPTGSISDITVTGNDGYMFSEKHSLSSREDVGYNTNYNSIIYSHVEKLLSSTFFTTFIVNDYLKVLLSEPSENLGGKGPTYLLAPLGRYEWTSLPTKLKSKSGYLKDTTNNSVTGIGSSGINTFTKLLRKGTQIKFGNSSGEYIWASITDVFNNGLLNLSTTTTGSIVLSRDIPEGWKVIEIVPHIRRNINNAELILIVDELPNSRNFGLHYDLENDTWVIIPHDNIIDTNDTFDLNPPVSSPNPDDASLLIDNRWLFKAEFITDSNESYYEFSSRGTRYVFGSDGDVSFHFNKSSRVVDQTTGKVVFDNIVILESNTNRSPINQVYMKARAIVGSFTTASNHNVNTEYTINTMLGVNVTNISNIVLYDSNDNVVQYTYTITSGTVKVKLLNASASSVIKISNLVDLYTPNASLTKLDKSYYFSIVGDYIRENGTRDTSKVVIAPSDKNYDNYSDEPLSFDTIIGTPELLFIETTLTVSGEYYDVIRDDIILIDSTTTILPENKVFYCLEDTIINNSGGTPFNYVAGTFYESYNDDVNTNAAIEVDEEMFKAVYGRYYNSEEPFMFTWKHYASTSERIDPSITNLMCAYVLTTEYDNAVRKWLKENARIADYPVPPTTTSLRNTLRHIEKNKMLSDQIIYIPAEYKLLFGETANSVYQCSFKVIRSSNSLATDNEIKSKILNAINDFFDLSNWDFGDGFYFSELNAFIHEQLDGIISSVVIVPKNENSRFGDLFEIKAEPHELFISCASVNDIEIVKSYTKTNMRRLS